MLSRAPIGNGLQQLQDMLHRPQPPRLDGRPQGPPDDRPAKRQRHLQAVPRNTNEVVLLQDANSFFGYEPILKALQATTDLPLARHIVPCQPAGAAAAAAGAAAVPEVAVPAYLAGGSTRYDLTLLINEDRISLLDAAEQARRVFRVHAAMCRVVIL
jgi:hypothetical protein